MKDLSYALDLLRTASGYLHTSLRKLPMSFSMEGQDILVMLNSVEFKLEEMERRAKEENIA
jgi:uncharacterized protein YehS (DUF1456 family)